MQDAQVKQEPPLVDAHAHIYTLDMPLASTAWHKPTEDASFEQYRAILDQHRVEYAVLAAATLYGDYNDYMIAACRRDRRLRTTVIVAPDTDFGVLKRMKEDGVVGVRFQWKGVAHPPDLTTPEYRRFLRHMADLDWHVQLHDDGPRLPAPIAAVEAAGVTLVVDHFGRPDPLKGIECAGFQAVLRSVERGNTWVKLASGFRLGPRAAALAQECAAELLKFAGPERLVWGSDWPFAAFEKSMTYEQTLASFEEWVPDAAMRRRISGETPLALFFS
jgi:predicted TIM-barrel fold metal-dependent hydrolase